MINLIILNMIVLYETDQVEKKTLSCMNGVMF